MCSSGADCDCGLSFNASLAVELPIQLRSICRLGNMTYPHRRKVDTSETRRYNIYKIEMGYGKMKWVFSLVLVKHRVRQAP